MARTQPTTPDDLIPSKRAAFIAKCSRDTLIRWAQKGLIREWRRNKGKGKGRWYSQAEVETHAPVETSARK